MGLPKPKNQLRRGSNKSSQVLSLSISEGTFWAKMAISSASVTAESVFGKLLMDFSSFVRSSLASLSDMAGMLKVSAHISAVPLFPDRVDSLVYTMTRLGVGTVGGMRSFAFLVKKDWI